MVCCAGGESGISKGNGEGHRQMSEVFVLGISLQAEMSGTKVTLSGWNPRKEQGSQSLGIPKDGFISASLEGFKERIRGPWAPGFSSGNCRDSLHSFVQVRGICRGL